MTKFRNRVTGQEVEVDPGDNKGRHTVFSRSTRWDAVGEGSPKAETQQSESEEQKTQQAKEQEEQKQSEPKSESNPDEGVDVSKLDKR